MEVPLTFSLLMGGLLGIEQKAGFESGFHDGLSSDQRREMGALIGRRIRTRLERPRVTREAQAVPVERRLLERLPQAPRSVLQLADLRRQRREEIVARGEPGARNREVAEVRREAFGNPEAARPDLVLVVERPELHRAEPLDVERVA